VGDALRAQLDIPTGRGLLVASLRGDSPSAQAGLKQNDILLSLADKPLAAADDLTKQLKAAGDSAVPLKVLRAGKPITIQVRPVYHVTIGAAREQKTEYYFGVSIEPADEALRAQLSLPSGQGVLVSDVVSGSPAEKAGVKKHDIVLELGGKPIDSPQTLASQVQTAQDKPTTLKLLRAGKPVTLPITGAVRKVETNPRQEAMRFWMVDHQAATVATLLRDSRMNETAAHRAQDLRERLDHLEQELKALRRIEDVEKELKALHEVLDKVNESLKAGKGTRPD
jgi:C-terminal processing protease CtpA/Prc